MAIPSISSETTSLTDLGREPKPPNPPPTTPKKFAIIHPSPLFYISRHQLPPSASIETALFPDCPPLQAALNKPKATIFNER